MQYLESHFINAPWKTRLKDWIKYKQIICRGNIGSETFEYRMYVIRTSYLAIQALVQRGRHDVYYFNPKWSKRLINLERLYRSIICCIAILLGRSATRIFHGEGHEICVVDMGNYSWTVVTLYDNLTVDIMQEEDDSP